VFRRDKVENGSFWFVGFAATCPSQGNTPAPISALAIEAVRRIDASFERSIKASVPSGACRWQYRIPSGVFLGGALSLAARQR
jgi:hypothetical protein